MSGKPYPLPLPEESYALPVPAEVMHEYRNNDPRALIRFLKSKKALMLPDARRINEEVAENRLSYDGKIIYNHRGYGYDCTCHGTGWRINGQVLCEKHIPDPRNLYFVIGKL